MAQTAEKTTPSKSPETGKGKGNTIFTIFPYIDRKQWLFDDADRDVYKEAFVAGADDLLDLVCKGADKCTVLFSASEFPNHDLTLSLIEAYKDGSADYYCLELKHNLWLCSCLAKYMNPPPENIYLKIKV